LVDKPEHPRGTEFDAFEVRAKGCEFSRSQTLLGGSFRYSRKERDVRSRVLCVVAIALVVVAAPAGAVTTRARTRAAAHYLVSRQAGDGSFEGSVSPVGGAADGIVSLVAARRGPKAIDRAVGYLKAQVRAGAVDTVGLQAKVVMAAVAAGRNARNFGGENIVRRIRTSIQPDGRYGSTTAVLDHALAVLALTAAETPVAPGATQWLAGAQCTDGGWQYDEPAGATDNEHCWDGTDTDFFQSDTNTTALAVQALASVPDTPQPAVSPFGFFRDARDDIKRGWGYDLTFTTTDANSTALVLQAFAAAGRSAPPAAVHALEDLQYLRCGQKYGAFAFTWIDPDGDGTYKRSGPDTYATTGGILGLFGKPLPIAEHDVTRPVSGCRE
jgi:hypothetical protein